MDIVSKRGWFFLISALIIVPGLISLMIPPPFKSGIEFSSGSVLNITFTGPVSEADVRDELTRLGHPEAIIQKIGDRVAFIRTNVLEEAVVGGDGRVVKPSERALIEEALAENVAPIESREYDTVSPIVARETIQKTIIAVIVASIGILAYVTWAFRGVPHSFRYGVATVLAAVHDIVVIIGVFSILGKVIDMEVNSMFIVGLLTVLGYTVNDTIVVFDRIRENMARNVDRPLETIVNTSIMETVGRSLNTSLATLFVLLALYLLGGTTIRDLLLVLLIGVVVGSYSTIFIASQFLVMWERGELLKALRFLRLMPARGGS